MNGFTYSIALQITGGNSLTRLIDTLDKVDKMVGKIPSGTSRASAGFQDMGRKGSEAFRSMQGEVTGLLAKIGLLNFGRNALGNVADMESFANAVNFASGGVEKGAQNMSFFNDTVSRLKLPIKESQQGFQTLLGSMQGTNISIETTRKLFEGAGIASRVMGLSGEKVGLIFKAFGDMASKSTIQMEELKGQLGDSLPGALALAADAMNMPISALMDMSKRSELTAEMLLPRLADKLIEKYGGGVPDALNSSRAKFDEMNNSVFRLSQKVGTELLPAVIPLIDNFLIPAVTWIGQNLDVLGMLGTMFLTVRTAALAYTVGQTIATFATGKATVSFWGLNSALLANPITWVVGGLLALAAGVVYAWNKFEGFRGFVMATWEVIKEFGKIIYDFAIAPLLAMGKTMIGVFTFDKALIREGIADSFKTFDKINEGLSTRLSNAVSRGWQDGLAAGAISLPKGMGGDAVTNTFGGRDLYELERDDRQGGGKGSGLDISKGINSITGGGSKNIHISIGKLVEKIEIHSATTGEGADEVAAIVQKKLLQVLNSANQTQ